MADCIAIVTSAEDTCRIAYIWFAMHSKRVFPQDQFFRSVGPARRVARHCKLRQLPGRRVFLSTRKKCMQALQIYRAVGDNNLSKQNGYMYTTGWVSDYYERQSWCCWQS